MGWLSRKSGSEAGSEPVRSRSVGQAGGKVLRKRLGLSESFTHFSIWKRFRKSSPQKNFKSGQMFFSVLDEKVVPC